MFFSGIYLHRPLSRQGQEKDRGNHQRKAGVIHGKEGDMEPKHREQRGYQRLCGAENSRFGRPPTSATPVKYSPKHSTLPTSTITANAAQAGGSKTPSIWLQGRRSRHKNTPAITIPQPVEVSVPHSAVRHRGCTE